MQQPQEGRRTFCSATMPALSALAVASIRFLFAWLCSRPTSKDGAVQEFGREFIAQTLIWSLVGMFTSVMLRLAVDRRILYSGRVARRPAFGTKPDPDLSWYQIECRVVTFAYVVFLVCAAMDAARPGTMAFAWLVFVGLYFLIT